MARWVKGADHNVPDAFSRAPVSRPDAADLELEKELTMIGQIAAAQSFAIAGPQSTERAGPSWQGADLQWQRVRQAADNDPLYVQLREQVTKGFPHHRQKLTEHLRSFRAIAAEISVYILSLIHI